MTTLFTVTINDQAQMGKAQETQLIHDALHKTAQQVRANKVATSGNIVLDKGLVVGTWSYTGSGGNN